MLIKDLMNTSPLFLYGGSTVEDAIKLMAKEGHSCVAVLDSAHSQKMVGIFTNKDLVARVLVKGKNPGSTFLKEVMTASPVTIPSSATTSDAMHLFEKHGFKHVPVVDGSHLSGIITSNDLLRGMLQYKKKLLDMAIDF